MALTEIFDEIRLRMAITRPLCAHRRASVPVAVKRHECVSKHGTNNGQERHCSTHQYSTRLAKLSMLVVLVVVSTGSMFAAVQKGM